MNPRLLFFLLLGVDTLLLLFKASDLSISYHEAQIFFNSEYSVRYYLSFFTQLFGQNDYALRYPMILLHVGSVILFYMLSKPYGKYERDRLWLSVIFMLLPGVTSAAVLVDEAGIVLFMLLLYLVLIQRYETLSYVILPILGMIDSSFMFLYLGHALYAIEQRRALFFVANSVLFVLTAGYYGFDFGGIPKSSFLDTLGIYTAIFSPIVFVYLFYTLYRRVVLAKRDAIFYIAATAFMISLILSFRQRIGVEMFAPFLMAALPLAMETFFHSYRVRLKMYRTLYKRLFFIAFGMLLIHSVVVFFHKELYHFLPDPRMHFAYRLHVAGELAEQLKNEGITCINAHNRAMQLRLRYYEITACEQYQMQSKLQNKNDINVTILHDNIPIFRTYVTKRNEL